MGSAASYRQFVHRFIVSPFNLDRQEIFPRLLLCLSLSETGIGHQRWCDITWSTDSHSSGSDECKLQLYSEKWQWDKGLGCLLSHFMGIAYRRTCKSLKIRPVTLFKVATGRFHTCFGWSMLFQLCYSKTLAICTRQTFCLEPWCDRQGRWSHTHLQGSGQGTCPVKVQRKYSAWCLFLARTDYRFWYLVFCKRYFEGKHHLGFQHVSMLWLKLLRGWTSAMVILTFQIQCFTMEYMCLQPTAIWILFLESKQ